MNLKGLALWVGTGWLVAAAAWAASEKLTFVGLKENEAIVIGYASSGCRHYLERKYVVRGGERLRFEIYERETQEPGYGYVGPERLIDSANLLPSEVRGLDYFVLFLLSPRPGASTTEDVISFGYYRDGQRIGEERFYEGSGALSSIYWHDGELQLPDRSHAEGMAFELFRSIRPPYVIEQRIRFPKRPQTE